MRLSALAVAMFLSAAPLPAAAQLSNRSISVESGLSAPLGRHAPAAAAFALAASTWLESFDAADLDGTVRVAYASTPETTGRAATAAVLATAGLRLSLGRAPLRPQLLADVGWARVRTDAASHRFAFGAGAGLEWFPVPDVSLAARAALRGAGGDVAAEAVLAFAAYF